MRQRLLLAAATLGVGVLSVGLVVSAIPQVPAAAPLLSEPPAAAVNARAISRIHSTNTDTVIVALRGKVANPAAAAVSAIRKAAWKVAGAKVVSSKALRADAATVTLNKSLTRKQADQIAAAAQKTAGVRYAEASVKFYPTDAGGDDYYWNIDQINASAAWRTATPDLQRSVVVGVIDTGIADNPLLPKALLVDTTDGVSSGRTISGTTWPGQAVTVTYQVGGVSRDAPAVTADERGKWSATLNPVADTGSTLTAATIDGSGNVTTTEDITVDSAVIGFTANKSNGTSFAGTVEAGSKVFLSYPEDYTTIEQAVVDGTSWTLAPHHTGWKHNDEVRVTATDRFGNPSDLLVVTIDLELSTPTLTAYNKTEIAGTADDDSTVTITVDEDGSAVCENLTPVAGRFSCVPASELADDTKFTVTAKDEAGNLTTKTGVIDGFKPDRPDPDPSNGSQFSGLAEKGATVRLTYPNGTFDEVTASAAGGWSLSNPTATLNNLDIVTVEATDAAGNTSEPATITIDQEAPAPPTINATNGELVSGDGEARAEVQITYSSGRVPRLVETTVTDQGTWTATLDPVANDRSKITVRLLDPAGNSSTAVSRVVHYGPPSTPAVAASNGESVSVIGVDELAKPGLLDANSDEVVGAWTELGEGAWKFVPETALTEADVVKAVVIDSDGVSSTPVTVTIDTTAPAAPAITAAAPTNVYGTAEAGTLARITYRDAADDEQSAETVTDTNGDWVFDLAPAAAVGSEITVKVTDAAGNAAQASTTIAEPTPAPSEDPTAVPETNSEAGEVDSADSDSSTSTELGDTKGSGTVLPGYNFIEDASAADPGTDSYRYHGTHVAGIVAATGYKKPTGVAPKVKILPIRALGESSGTLVDIADAISWGAGVDFYDRDGNVKTSPYPENPYPADVLNLSLGSRGTTCPKYLQSAITEAVKKGTVVVVSAGNDHTDIKTQAPANCTGVIVVTATGADGSRASYSNWGSSPGSSLLVAAPGGSGTSPDCNPDAGWACTGLVWSTGNQNLLALSGTSMAAPHVAGTAALLKALDKNLSPDEIATYIRGTTTPLADGCPTGTCGSGIVNAAAAVAAAANPVTPDGGGSAVNVPAAKYPSIWVNLQGTSSVGSTLTASSGSSYGSYSYQWLRNGTPISHATGRVYTLTSTDRSQLVTVKVTGFGGLSATSNPVRPGTGTLRFTTVPTISGTRKVGKKLTVKYVVAPTVSTVTKTFQWYRSSGKSFAKISKATKSTYKLTKKDRGKKIFVKVTLSAPGYTTILRTSAKTGSAKR